MLLASTASTPSSRGDCRNASPGPGRGPATTGPSSSRSPCGSRPTRRSWSPAPYASCSRSTPRERRPRLRRRRAVDRVGPRRQPRLRRPGAHPRQHRAASRRRRLAGAGAVPRAAGARRAHPRHRRARQPARRRRRRPQGGRGRRAVAAPPRPRRHREGRADRGAQGTQARGAAADGLFGPEALFGFQWQLALHGDAADRRGDGPARGRRDADHQAPRQLDRRRLPRCSSAPSAG